MVTAHPPNRSRMLLVLLGSTAVLIAALFVGSRTRGYETLLVLADLNAGSKPSRLKALIPPPTRTSLSYTAWGQSYIADLYLPGQGRPEAGILLVPGVVRNAKDDPRLVAFATTLARARFAVLVPDLPSFNALQVHPEDAVPISAAFSYLVGHADLAPAGRAGITALSFAVGLSVLAALDEHIREQVRFILGVGGYYDMTETITFFTTGYFQKDARWQHLEPDLYPARVFLDSALDALQDPADRDVFESIEKLKLSNPTADTSLFAARLSPEGRTLYDLLSNSDPRRTPELLGHTPQPIQDMVSRLTLSNKDLTRLKARLMLVADPTDPMIPYTQSFELAHAVPKGQAHVRLLGSLAHVELKPIDYLSWKFLSSGMADFWGMYQTVYGLLGERG